MIARIVAVVAVAVFLTGYVPRALAIGSHAWIIWLVAVLIVFGGPRLLRRTVARVVAFGRGALPLARTRLRN